MESVWIVIAIWGLYFWYSSWEEKRRREQPERLRRMSRDLEHRILIAMGREDVLRAMLLEDLRQIAARHRAVAWARENFGIDIEYPPPKFSQYKWWQWWRI